MTMQSIISLNNSPESLVVSNENLAMNQLWLGAYGARSSHSARNSPGFVPTGATQPDVVGTGWLRRSSRAPRTASNSR